MTWQTPTKEFSLSAKTLLTEAPTAAQRWWSAAARRDGPGNECVAVVELLARLRARVAQPAQVAEQLVLAVAAGIYCSRR